jgi:hypothetical protein
MDTTLIYIHRGLTHYLDGVFALTRHFNKTNKNIILIGDEDNKAVSEKYGFKHYFYSDYDEQIEYHHISVQKEPYEKFCFSRWFILKNFMNKNNIEHAVYSDSDNAVIYNFNSIKYDNACLCDKTVVVPNLLFCNKDTINKICAFYKDLYSLNYADFFLKLMESKYLTYHENDTNKPHFSDMMFLSMAIDELQLKFTKLQETATSGPIFNSNINNVKVVLKGKRVYLYNSNNFLLNIHFAGLAKTKVTNYLSILQY